MTENEWTIFLNFYSSLSCWHPGPVSKFLALPLQLLWAINHDMTGRYWENYTWPKHGISNPWICPPTNSSSKKPKKIHAEKTRKNMSYSWEFNSNISLHVRFLMSEARQCEGLFRLKATPSPHPTPQDPQPWWGKRSHCTVITRSWQAGHLACAPVSCSHGQLQSILE